jgi:hypothetical protein
VRRAYHWLEAERLQALGIDRINHLMTIGQSKGLWQDTAMKYEETVAKLYFRAAQVSACLAQAGPGLDAEVAAIQKERPPMPPPPPRAVAELMCTCTAFPGPELHRYQDGCKGWNRNG